MWRLPDGRILRHAKQFKLEDTVYPGNIFRLWTPEELATKGIKEYSEQKVDERYYSKVNVRVEETATTYKLACDQTPKMNRAALLNKMNILIKTTLISMYMTRKHEAETWAELDPTEATEALADLTAYRTQLRAAYQAIKAAYLALTDYQDIIDFQWQSLLPVKPLV